MRRASFLLFALIITSAMLFAQKTDSQDKQVSLHGTLRHVAAIGGETTGWAIEVDPAQQKLLGKRLEIDPSKSLTPDISQYEDKEVNVTGTLTWREGVERGRYRVLLLDTISQMEKMPGGGTNPK